MRSLDERFAAAIGLAEEAGALAMRMRPARGAPAATLKGVQDWLTEADGAVEKFLADRLAALFPGDGFVGEEGGPRASGTFRWVADPIDGTSNYARGGEQFCVSLALIEDRTPLIGVLAAPALGQTYAARRGGGATLNGRTIRAAATSDPTRAMVEVNWNPRRATDAFWAMCVRIAATGAMLRIGGSGALGLARVASGEIDAYAELHINLWDCAAAIAILEEAGATVSPFMHGDGPVTGDAILAAAPGIADALSVASGIRRS